MSCSMLVAQRRWSACVGFFACVCARPPAKRKKRMVAIFLAPRRAQVHAYAHNTPNNNKSGGMGMSVQRTVGFITQHAGAHKEDSHAHLHTHGYDRDGPTLVGAWQPKRGGHGQGYGHARGARHSRGPRASPQGNHCVHLTTT
nr:hypothetical protein [Pandoravirus massiliensis]